MEPSGGKSIGRRSFLAGTGAAGLGFALGGCGGNPGGAAAGGSGGLPTVKLQGFSGGLTGVALKIVESNGFDEKNGFKGEYFYVDPAAATQFFLQKKSDLTFDFDPLNTAIAREQGLKVTTFYPVNPNNNCILVRGDSPYNDPKELVGKKVGHFGADSGTTTSASVVLQDFYGIDVLNDYNLVESDPATLVEFLDRGEVEAIFDFVPHSSRAMAQNNARCMFGPFVQEWESRREGTNLLTSMAAYEDWLRENIDLAKNVIAAWNDAYAWITEEPSRITEDPYASLLGQDDPAVLDLIAQQVTEVPLFSQEWNADIVQSLTDFVHLAAEQDILIKEAPGGTVSSIEDFEG